MPSKLLCATICSICFSASCEVDSRALRSGHFWISMFAPF